MYRCLNIHADVGECFAQPIAILPSTHKIAYSDQRASEAKCLNRSGSNPFASLAQVLLAEPHAPSAHEHLQRRLAILGQRWLKKCLSRQRGCDKAQWLSYLKQNLISISAWRGQVGLSKARACPKINLQKSPDEANALIVDLLELTGEASEGVKLTFHREAKLRISVGLRASFKTGQSTCNRHHGHDRVGLRFQFQHV